MKPELKLKSVVVKTTHGTEHFYLADAKVVAQAILDANVNGLEMTFPIWLDDSATEVQFTLRNIVTVVKEYLKPEGDE